MYAALPITEFAVRLLDLDGLHVLEGGHCRRSGGRRVGSGEALAPRKGRERRLASPVAKQPLCWQKGWAQGKVRWVQTAWRL